MKARVQIKSDTPDVLQSQDIEKTVLKEIKAEAFAELEHGVHTALETYSNVHRGSGHYSQVSTHLYEQAREIVLEHLGLNKEKYNVIFCTPRRAELFKAQLRPESYQCLSSQDMDLPLGVRALAVKRNALTRMVTFQTGGGTARLVSPGWVIWTQAPDKFEAGTPAIINIIAFTRALGLIQQFENNVFRNAAAEKLSVATKSATDRKLIATEILHHDELEQSTGRELLDKLRQTLIGRGVRVPTGEGFRSFINLDNGASTPTFTPIWEVVCQTWRQPKPVLQEIIREVKSICAEVLGAPLEAYDVIFTSNTTEAINLAAESLSKESEHGTRAVVLNTLLEHNSNELPWRTLSDFSLIRLPVDAEGFVDLKKLETLLCSYNQNGQHRKKRIKLVAVSGASNVLGIFNNLTEISRIVHHYGARLLVDAAQLVAHREVEMERCEIDYLAFSGHKIYAPFGSGVLLIRKGLHNFGSAELELIQSSGEENVAGIAALGKALLLLQRVGLDLIQEEEQALTGQALRGLAQIPGLAIYGIKDPDSPRFTQKSGVIVFGLKNIMANRVAQELAEQGGIGVRFGCHCAHLLIKHLLNIHPLLELLQGLIVALFPQVALPGLTRVSLGIQNSADEIDTLILELGKIALQSQTGGKSPFTSVKTNVQRQMDEFVRAAAQRVYPQLNKIE